jgi:hypothetical protein
MSELYPSVPVASTEPVPPGDGARTDGSPVGDGYDRDRVLRLLGRLERDIAAVEVAMVHAEAGDHEAFTATVAPLETQLVD